MEVEIEGGVVAVVGLGNDVVEEFVLELAVDLMFVDKSEVAVSEIAESLVASPHSHTKTLASLLHHHFQNWTHDSPHTFPATVLYSLPSASQQFPLKPEDSKEEINLFSSDSA